MSMIYNELGRSGIRISAISFGAMRWPSEQACFEIMNRGMDLGFNYVDTSTGYVDGQSEAWTGRAVKHRRNDIMFSAKSHWNSAPSADTVRATIEKSLKHAELDYFDFFQMWGIQTMETVEGAVAKGGTVEGVRKAQDDGLIKHGLGFTFHGEPDVFRAAIDTGEFLCATVSYNLMNRKEEEQINYAASRGVGIVVMNPVAGGVLALAGRNSTLNFLCGNGIGPSYGALRFLLANKGISTSILGASRVEDVEEAMAVMEGAQALDEAYRQDLIAKMDAVTPIEGDFCTGCGYCKDCPQGLNPSRFMQAMRDAVIYDVAPDRMREWILSRYPHSSIVDELAKCTACGACEDKCPQHLKIIEQIDFGKATLAG